MLEKAILSTMIIARDPIELGNATSAVLKINTRFGLK